MNKPFSFIKYSLFERDRAELRWMYRQFGHWGVLRHDWNMALRDPAYLVILATTIGALIYALAQR
jgi:hypothetical protein